MAATRAASASKLSAPDTTTARSSSSVPGSAPDPRRAAPEVLPAARAEPNSAMTTTQEATPSTEHPIRGRAVLLAAVAACAACGIIYELALLTLSASLNGGGIVAPSLIVAGYIAALGAGALLVKPLLRHAAITFIAVEALLGIVGGLSAAALYVVFAFVDGSTWVLAISTALIGGLVGAEVPLLMTLLQRGTAGTDMAADTGRTLANLNAADYLGALLGGLVWPFLLLPQLGMIR